MEGGVDFVNDIYEMDLNKVLSVLAQKHAAIFYAVDFPNRGSSPLPLHFFATTSTTANFYSAACPSFTGVAL